MTVCPKCKYESGDDWRQCKGSCPMPMSPHYQPTPGLHENFAEEAAMSTDKAVVTGELAAHIHLIRVFAQDTNERNWADKRLYIMQQADRAAAEITRLQKELETARRALEPFAEAARQADEDAARMGFAPSFDEYEVGWNFSFGQLRRARAALKDKEVAACGHPVDDSP